MQTEDDEPKADADHVLGADRVLRERKHPMQKFLEDQASFAHAAAEEGLDSVVAPGPRPSLLWQFSEATALVPQEHQ